MRARALALGLSLSGHALGAEPQPYRIDYTAPADCSSRDAFVRELVERTPRVRVAADAELAAAYIVTLSARSTDLFGELVLRELDGRETRRALRGKTCDEVVSALAFIAAILVDPTALSRTKTEAPRAAPARSAPPSSEPTDSRVEGRFRLGAGAGASLETTVSPKPAFGPFAEILVERVGSEGQRGLSFGAAFHRVSATPVITAAGRAEFTWTAGRGWVCPVSLPSRGVFSFVPCGEVEGGTLVAEGSDTIDRKTVVRPWLAFGPLARFELRPASFIAVTLDAMAVFTPLSHPAFYFSPDIEVFSVPVVGFASRAGIRAILP